eukprot:COSAG02_NODE_567_length_20212_cov_18.927460_9_plen_134_part_00
MKGCARSHARGSQAKIYAKAEAKKVVIEKLEAKATTNDMGFTQPPPLVKRRPRATTKASLASLHTTIEKELKKIDHDYPYIKGGTTKQDRTGDPVLLREASDEVYGVIGPDGMRWLLELCTRKRLMFIDLGCG